MLLGSKADTCSSRGQEKVFQLAIPKDQICEFIERTCHYVVASHGLQGKIKNEVVEDFASKPHKAVTFLVERDGELLPGFSGGKLPGRIKVEEE